MLEAAIKLEARMRPVVDLVKRAAFMGPTVSSVPYAHGGADLALRDEAAKGPSPFRTGRYREGFNGGRTQSRARSRSCFGSAGAGASVITSSACWFLGKAITSRIVSWPAASITTRSRPYANPPCGGAP